MDTKGWIILALIAFILLDYNKTIDGEGLIGKGQNLTMSTWNSFMHKNETCPTQYDPVCGNGVTYNNRCEAGKAGLSEVTLGVCQ